MKQLQWSFSSSVMIKCHSHINRWSDRLKYCVLTCWSLYQTQQMNLESSVMSNKSFFTLLAVLFCIWHGHISLSSPPWSPAPYTLSSAPRDPGSAPWPPLTFRRWEELGHELRDVRKLLVGVQHVHGLLHLLQTKQHDQSEHSVHVWLWYYEFIPASSPDHWGWWL